MYKVILNNNGVKYNIHNMGTNKEFSKLVSGNINEGINTIPSFEFKILPNNIAFNEIVPFYSKITVINTKTNEEVFDGRVLKVNPKMDSTGATSKLVTCEGNLAYLCDSIQPYTPERKWETDEESTGLYKYISYLLENHNNQVEESKRIYPGVINGPTLTEDNSVDKGTNYETTWDIINSKIAKDFGGEVSIRKQDGLLYLDYLDSIGEKKATPIELKKNMKSVDREVDYSTTFTRLIPLGAKIKTEDAAGNLIDTDERLTIASVNNNVIWLDTNLVNELGIITKVVEFNDIEIAENLLRKATEYLEDYNAATESHKITAVDLSLIDDSFEEFKLGNIYPVKNPLINLDKDLRIIKRKIDICNPTSSTFDIGDTKALLSDLLSAKDKSVADILQQIDSITSNYVKNSTLSYTYSKTVSLIVQKYNEITLLLQENYVTNSDFSKSLERISKIEMLIDEITLLVSQVQSLCGFASGTGQLNFGNGSESIALYFAIEGYYEYRNIDDVFFLSKNKFISNHRFISGFRKYIKSNTLTLCVDTQPKGNPSKNIHKYVIDLDYPLLSDGEKKDIFEIQLNSNHELVGQITRYFTLDEMNNRVELEEPIYKKIEPISIELFDGENYIYIEETNLYNMILEYVTNDASNNYWATYAQLKLTESSILFDVESTYETMESAKARIEMLAGSIILGVENSEGKEASIKLSVNGTEQVGTIVMNGLVAFEDLSTTGKTTICGDNITTGTIDASIVNVVNLNASNIKSGTISADKISGGTIDGNNINVKNLNASNITSGTMSADKISGGTIDGNNITVKNLNASNITGGSLNADRISGGTMSSSSISIGGNSYYLKMGTGWTKHPEVSGLNITGNGGIAMNNHGISNCASVTNSKGDLYLASNSGTVHIGHGASGSSLPIEVSGSKVYINQYLDVTTNSFYVRKVNGSQILLTAYINEASSKRIKENIKCLDNSFLDSIYEEIEKLPLYSYDYKKSYISSDNDRKNKYGFMLDDVENTNIGKVLDIETSETTSMYSGKSLAKLDLFLIKKLIYKIDELTKRLEVIENG